MTEERRKEYALMRYGIIAPAVCHLIPEGGHSLRRPRTRSIPIQTEKLSVMRLKPWKGGVTSTKKMDLTHCSDSHGRTRESLEKLMRTFTSRSGI